MFDPDVDRFLVKVILLLFELSIKRSKSTLPPLDLFDNGESIHFPIILLLLFANVPLKMSAMVLGLTFGAAVPNIQTVLFACLTS